MKSIFFRDLPDDLCRKFKVRCTENGETQKQVFIRLMRNEIDRPDNVPPFSRLEEEKAI